ncbi:MAG: ankyrin repeat domain-containing protein [Planctomycetota bacterium]
MSNTAIEKEFFSAIESGKTDEVRRFVLDDPGLLNSFNANCFGATPLTTVTFKDDREMVRVLLELGADPNRRSDWNMGPWSPLHSAIHSNKMDLVSYLLANGAEMDLHTAAALGRIDEIDRLLDEDPERISEQGGDGCLPLHFAGTIEAAQRLLDRAADINARCIDHYSTAVQYLAGPRPEVARYLMQQGASVDIFSAAMCGDLDQVRCLVADDPLVLNLRIGQDVFPPGPEHDVHNILTFTVGGGCSALHAAVTGGQCEMIGELVRLGMDPDVRGGHDDATPLHQAAWHDDTESAKALVESGAGIDLRSGPIHDNTPAGWAIVGGSANVFEYLMDQGAEVLDFFESSAVAAVNGEFRKYKYATQGNYQRILDRVRLGNSA